MLKPTLIALSFLSAACSMNLVHADDQTDQKIESQNQGKQHHKRPVFSDLDLDSNGSVTLEEFKQHKIPHGQHEKAFSHIDSNSDQSISEIELTNHKPPKHHQQRK